MNSPSLPQLIDTLSADLPPVEPLWSPAIRSSLWMGCSFLFVVAWVFISGDVRAGVFDQLFLSPRFLLEVVFALISAPIAAWYAFRFSSAALAPSFINKAFSVAPTMVFVALSLYGLLNPALPTNHQGHRIGCQLEIVAIAIIPMSAFIYYARKALPLERRWIALLIGIAASMPMTTAMLLACSYDPLHNVLFHLTPVVAFAAAGYTLAGKIFPR